MGRNYIKYIFLKIDLHFSTSLLIASVYKKKGNYLQVVTGYTYEKNS